MQDSYLTWRTGCVILRGGVDRQYFWFPTLVCGLCLLTIKLIPPRLFVSV